MEAPGKIKHITLISEICKLKMGLESQNDDASPGRIRARITQTELLKIF